MKTLFITLVAMSGLVLAEEGRWIPIFNGKDLAGWTPKIRGCKAGENFQDTFRVEDGVLKGVRQNREILISRLKDMREAFACGTGVTLAPIGSITDREDRFEMNVSEGGIGPVTKLIRDRLTAVMSGRHQSERYEGWLREVRRAA